MINKKRKLSILLVVSLLIINMLIPLTSIKAEAATETGEVGGLKWTFDNSTGTMTVTGDAKDEWTLIPYLGMSLKWETHAPWIQLEREGKRIKHLKFVDCNISQVNNMVYMFSGLTSLETLDLGDKFDTSNVTNMGGMFNRLSSLKSLNLGNKFDTSKVKNMDMMFNGMTALQTLELGNKFDTSNVTTMQYMFAGLTSLKQLDLKDKFDTSNVQTMGRMFSSIPFPFKYLHIEFPDTPFKNVSTERFNYSLKTLNLGNKFNTSKVNDMTEMFFGLTSLQSLDLGDKFDTSNVNNMWGMFAGLESVKSLDLRENFDTSQVLSFTDMFAGMKKLEVLNMGDKFFTEQVDNRYDPKLEDPNSEFDPGWNTPFANMFYNVSKLKSVKTGNDLLDRRLNPPESQPISQSETELYTGKWIKKYDYEGNRLYNQTPKEQIWGGDLARNIAGTWVWETKFDVDDFGDGKYVYTLNDPTEKKGDKWIYRFKVIDDSVDYFIKEIPKNQSDTEKYTPIYTNGSKGWQHFDSFNKRDGVYKLINKSTKTPTPWEIMIAKDVINKEDDTSFTVEVTLHSDTKDLSGKILIDDIVFKDGKALINVSENSPKTIKNIPYYINIDRTEIKEILDDPKYEYVETIIQPPSGIPQTGKGPINFNPMWRFILKNKPTTTEPKPKLATLYLTKRLYGHFDEETSKQSFKFKISLTGLEKNKAYSAFPIGEGNKVNFKANSKGEANIELSLKNNEMYKIDLPVNATYQINETAGDYKPSYVIKQNTGDENENINKSADNGEKNKELSTTKETLSRIAVGDRYKPESNTVEFTNKIEQLASLKIAKAIKGSNVDNKAKFNFHLTFKNMKPNSTLDTSIGRIVADEEGIAEIGFKLSNNQNVLIENIPSYITYVVSEEDNTLGYRSQYTVGEENGAITKPDSKGFGATQVVNQDLATDEIQLEPNKRDIVKFTNMKDDKISITKKVEGNFGNKNELFTFKVKMSLKDNKLPIVESFPTVRHTSQGDVKDVLTLNSDGEGFVTIKHGETIDIQGVKLNSEYNINVEEVGADVYNTKATVKQTKYSENATPIADINVDTKIVNFNKEQESNVNIEYTNTSNSEVPTMFDDNFKILILILLLTVFAVAYKVYSVNKGRNN